MITPIYASNTVDAGLKNTSLTTTAIPILKHRLQGLAACTTFVEGNATGSGGMAFVVPVLSTSGARLTNPSNMQSGDVTMVAGSLAGAHIARSGHISNAERGLGLRREHLIPTLINKYVDDLIELAMTTVTATNYGASLGTVTTSNLDETTVELMVDGVDGQPRCILTSAKAIHGIRANLSRENGKWVTPNVEGAVWEMSLAAAGDNASAVIATPEAIVGVIALPPGLKLQMGEDLKITPLDIEGLGTMGWITTWIDRGTRAEWVAVESVCAFGVGQSTALRFVASS